MIIKDTVLILTNGREATIERVVGSLKNLGQRFVRVNTDSLIELKGFITLSLSRDGSYISNIQTQDTFLDMRSIKSVWCRRPEYPKAPVNNDFPVQKSFIEAEFKSTLWSLYSLSEVYWINPLLNGLCLLEHNKPYQLSIATSVGLLIPDTIVTNNSKELYQFCENNGGVVAVKSARSRMFDGDSDDSYAIYTTKVTSADIIRFEQGLDLAPVTAQAYIPKKFELRVTIIGEQIFACAIHSQDSEKTKDDWRRYDFGNVKHESFNLPEEIKYKLLKFMQKCGISFGAIDMVLTPQNEYVFLEVNPSGQFGWIEALTGMPISMAIAEALSNCH